jgi:phenylacetate-CoA ligase
MDEFFDWSAVASLSILAKAAAQHLSLLRSQYWDREKQAAYIQSRLEQTLQAAARISFYAERFEGDPCASEFGRLPILQRADVPLLNHAVRSAFPAKTKYSSDCSSGSTGMPVEFLFDQSHQASRFAARARYLRENRWNPARSNVWLIYTGAYTGSEDRNLIQTHLMPLNHFLPIPTDFRRLALEVGRFDPAFLYAYPSFLEALMDALQQTGVRLRSLQRIFCGSEVLNDHVRSRARSLFGVDISDNYGSTEAFIAWQCPSGKYHINSEHVFVEIVDEQGAPSPAGEMGRVLVTTLQNNLMPLVRYEIGDYAVASVEQCQCGRTLPTLDRVVGRSVNLFRLRGGQLLSPWILMGAVRDRIEVKQFQVVQQAIDQFLVKVVADKMVSPDQKESLQADFSRFIGYEVNVLVEQVAEIPRTTGGKFMTTISELAA